MNSIGEQINKLKKDLPKRVTLVAVSKTKPVEIIMEAYEAGHRIFGENKVQELVSKYEVMPKDIEWHLIGHLQTNKVKYIAGFVKLIHSVDSLKLLQAIDEEGKKNNRIIDCLLQLKIAKEESKFGIALPEVYSLLQSDSFKSLNNVSIRGVMGMATFTSDLQQVRDEFRTLKTIFDKLQAEYFKNDGTFSEISMGMSDDYSIAIEEGSTIVRVGSKIFGDRIYNK